MAPSPKPEVEMEVMRIENLFTRLVVLSNAAKSGVQENIMSTSLIQYRWMYAQLSVLTMNPFSFSMTGSFAGFSTSCSVR